jgi:hypothetical protein
VANANSNTVSVLLGNGDGSFQAHADYATGTEPESVAVGDFNGDGKLDLVVANANAGTTVSVLLGNGDGTFQKQVTYDTGYEPVSVSAGDLNGDGKLDLAVATFGGNSVSVLQGNGDGTFQPHVDYQTAGGPTSVQLGDLNGDGKLDLAVANYATNTLGVLLGNGDGTFQPEVDYGAGAFPLSLVLGDFNRDGRLDLAVTSYGDNTIYVFLEAGTINLKPASLNFGVRLVGSRSEVKAVTLTNIGTKKVAISSIAITGAEAGDFSEHNHCPSSLPPRAHCTIRASFKPTNFGPRTAAVTITDNAQGSPQLVPLSGIGAHSGPNATLSKSLMFATQLVGTTSPPQPVRLSNYGTQTLDITSIVASGDFSELNNCGSGLPPGEYCTINVTFTPTHLGHRTGMVSITDNAPDSPQKVRLSGVGTVVKLDPTSLDFGGVIVGQKSSPQNTTLTNVGKTRLHITDITITGTDSGDFSEQNNCPDPGYLGAGKSCTIMVTFQPTQVGSRSADVSVSDDGGDSPQQVSLSGIGQSACGGRCGFGGQCPTGCRCVFGFCRAASSAVVEETASRQACSQTNRFTELR